MGRPYSLPISLPIISLPPRHTSLNIGFLRNTNLLQYLWVGNVGRPSTGEKIADGVHAVREDVFASVFPQAGHVRRQDHILQGK